jgi:hypothetical protein
MKITEIEGYETLATKADLQELRAEVHKEFGNFKYDLTWRLITILGMQTIIILGAVYFMLAYWKP